MRRILLLTSIYPGPDIPQNATPVVHYFAKEWMKLGYDIRVIVNSTYFPSFLYRLPKFLKDYVARHTSAIIPIRKLSEKVSYNIDGIRVTRLPIYKVLPMGRFKKYELENQVKKIKDILTDENFHPDIIIGHWATPQFYLVAKLGEIFSSKTVIVLHESGKIIRKIPDYKKLLPQINNWGYRSNSIKNSFQKEFLITPNFRCFSGIPSYYLENQNNREWSKANRYVFVGQLIQRKYPDILIKALQKSYGNQEFKLSIVGDGPMMSQLRTISKDDNRVELLGRINRNRIIKILDNSDIFIMISSSEVFGLVYIEAMARGCIVVAATGEGMEGIIESGHNGFLCTPGSESELIQVIKLIQNLSTDERKLISQKAIKTASVLTDSKVAKNYLDEIM